MLNSEGEIITAFKSAGLLAAKTLTVDANMNERMHNILHVLYANDMPMLWVQATLNSWSLQLKSLCILNTDGMNKADVAFVYLQQEDSMRYKASQREQLFQKALCDVVWQIAYNFNPSIS